MTNRKTLTLAKRLSFGALCISGVVVASTAQAQNLDVRPLVRIQADFTETTPTPRLETSEFTFISRGGYVFKQSGISAATGTLDGIVGRGFATLSERGVIRDILTRGQIGLQRDCVFLGTGLTGQTQISWYGRDGRRNAFRYVYSEDLSSGFPACGEQALRLLEGLGFIAGVIVSEGELFITPPGP